MAEHETTPGRPANAALKAVPLEPVSNRTLVDAVAEKLRESILSGRFAPGERLVEAELARELAVSRGPVREALASLEKDGLLVTIPRRGKFLPAFDSKSVDEIYSLRKVIEPYAVDLVIASLDDDKRRMVRESVSALQEAAEAGDVVELAQRDLDFHDVLYRAAGHELLYKVWTEAIFGKLRMLLNFTVPTHPLNSTADNHQVIVEAILDGDAERARTLLIDHIDDAWQRARTALEGAEAAAQAD